MPPNLKIDIYTSRFNPECIRAKGLLDRTGVDYNEFDVDLDEFHREIMKKRSGGRTSVPQVFINGKAIVGLAPDPAKQHLIKRVIAVGGETISIKDCQVFINGKAIGGFDGLEGYLASLGGGSAGPGAGGNANPSSL